MTIQQSIEKAIEGGYRRPNPCYIEGIKVYHKGDTFLDPLFWQSLGKAMGWEGFYKGVDDDTWSLYDLSGKEGFIFEEKWIPKWEKKWHKFISHLAEGKTAESFFKDL